VDKAFVVNMMDGHDELLGVVASHLLAECPARLQVVEELASGCEFAHNDAHSARVATLVAQFSIFFEVHHFYDARVLELSLNFHLAVEVVNAALRLVQLDDLSCELVRRVALLSCKFDNTARAAANCVQKLEFLDS